MDHPPQRTVRWRPSAVLLLIILVLTQGCANLSAVREFANISTESAQYTRLVDDYAQSPIRQKQYRPAREHEGLERINRERTALQERLLLRHSLIEEYMDTLGRLAADEVVVYNKELDALGNAVKEKKFVDAKEADAFAAIAKVLVKGATDRWRQKQLKELIAISNGPFQVVVESLRIVVENGFRGDLLNEKAAIQSYYGTLILDSRDKAGIAALEEWRNLRLAALETRAKAIESYAKILRTISEGHQKLYDGRNDLSRELLVRDMSRYSRDLKRLFNTIRNL